MNLFNDKLNILQKGLDVTWLRNQVISNNIANVDTPNFKTSRVEFDQFLDAEMGRSGLAMKKSNQKHMNTSGDTGGIMPEVVKNNSTSMRLDGNNVDIENEMVELTKNNLMYQTLIQKTSKEISKIKYAINEGKR